MQNVRFIAVGCCFIWLAMTALGPAQTVVNRGGQTVEGDILRGQGAFLRGAAWYDLKTAEANAANVDANIRWKEDLRKIQHERDILEAQKKYEKTKNVEQLKEKIVQRERELRANPTPDDVQSGAALNALVYDLTDPDITSYRWSSNRVELPAGSSVKELIFRFIPRNASTQASLALSRGVIALSRLDIKDKWPVLLKKDNLANERKAYEEAYDGVREKVARGDYAVDEILALDKTLGDLKRKIITEVPSERGFRAEATRFVDDLRDATRMFDANAVDYAREILTDTKDHDAKTVQELVEFMSKYRLRFANSDRSPTARVLYPQIYEALRKQIEVLNINPEPAPPRPPLAEGDKAAAKLTGVVPAPRGTGAYEPIGNPGLVPVDAEGKPLNMSFETGSLQNWKAEGTAFAGQPVDKGRNGEMGRLHSGRFFIGGGHAGVQAQGTLTSETFVAAHPYASYLVAGTGPYWRVEIVTADNKKVFHSTPDQSGPMKPVVVDLRKIMGKKIFVRLVDQDPTKFLNFDDFRLHDAPPKFASDGPSSANSSAGSGEKKK